MADWFEALFGFTEESKAVVHEFLQVKGSSMHSLVNDSKFSIGTFSTPSLAELRARNQKNLGKLHGQLRLSVVKGDVSAFMADEANRHAVFQVASQFNCLEFPGPRTTPEQGVTGYVFDKTQGPCCSIACGAGTVYRNYFAPIIVSSQTTQIGQSKAHQLNNLKEVSLYLGNEEGVVTRSPRRKKFAYFDHSAGYTMATREGLVALNSKLDSIGEKGIEKAKSLLRIGLQADVQVTSKNWGKEQIRRKLQTVNQVFGSACSVAYSEGSTKSWSRFASLVLDASYEATFWVALETAVRHAASGGSNKLFLTLLGGGVFGNSFEWIANAIGKAARKFTNTGLDVRIVFYGPVCDEIKTMIHEYNEWLVETENSESENKKGAKEAEEEAEKEEEDVVAFDSDEETFRKRRIAARTPTKKAAAAASEDDDDNWTEVEVVEATSEDYVELTTVIASSISTTATSTSLRASSRVAAKLAMTTVESSSSITTTHTTTKLKGDDVPLPPRATRSRSPHPSTRSRSPHPSTRSVRSRSPKPAPPAQEEETAPEVLTYGKRRATAPRLSPRKTTRKT